MHRTDGRRLCALLTLLAALLLSGCVRTQPPDESDGGTARPDMPAPAPAVSAIDLAHATEEQLFYIGELTEALPALLEADRALTEIFVCGRLYLEGDYGAVDPYTPFPVEQGEKYADFAEITALFDDAFGAGGAGREEFLAYPAYGRPAVSERDGATYITSHFLLAFTDFFTADDVQVLDINAAGASLYAVTPGGQGVYFGAVRTGSGWFLRRGTYFAYLDALREAERIADWHSSPDFDTGMGEGSAGSLTGRCLIVNVFLSDPESGWSGEEVSRVLEMLGEGTAFLNASAAAEGVELSLTCTGEADSLYFRTETVLPSDYMDFGWTGGIFDGGLEPFVRRSIDIDAYDGYCVMLHVNKQGRSYALSCNSAYYDYRLYAAERCVMYYTADDTYEYAPNVSMYMHEMLHLFGAEDLYVPYLAADEDKRIEAYCPGELMRYVPTDIQETSLSPYTMFRIGWRNRLDRQFAAFAD